MKSSAVIWVSSPRFGLYTESCGKFYFQQSFHRILWPRIVWLEGFSTPFFLVFSFCQLLGTFLSYNNRKVKEKEVEMRVDKEVAIVNWIWTDQMEYLLAEGIKSLSYTFTRLCHTSLIIYYVVSGDRGKLWFKHDRFSVRPVKYFISHQLNLLLGRGVYKREGPCLLPPPRNPRISFF